MPRTVVGLLVAAAVVACSGPAVAPPTQPSCDQSNFADVVEDVAPSVVTVRLSQGVGSGVVFKSDVVLTNNHVVTNNTEVTIVYADGSESRAAVVAGDPGTDVAVVRTERKGLTPARFAAGPPRPGCPVLAIGSPLGLQNSVTAGVVSGLRRSIPASQQGSALVDLIQTDAPISPGNSGGALLDTQGQVVGVNEAYIPPEAGAVSIGFAIPAAAAVDAAEQLLAGMASSRVRARATRRSLTRITDPRRVSWRRNSWRCSGGGLGYVSGRPGPAQARRLPYRSSMTAGSPVSRCNAWTIPGSPVPDADTPHRFR